MYNKLILENLGWPFEITYGGQLHLIPKGKFEAEQELGYFIAGIAKKWWKKVYRLSEPEEPKVEAIVPVKVTPIEESEDVIKTETVVEENKTSKKKK